MLAFFTNWKNHQKASLAEMELQSYNTNATQPHNNVHKLHKDSSVIQLPDGATSLSNFTHWLQLFPLGERKKQQPQDDKRGSEGNTYLPSPRVGDLPVETDVEVVATLIGHKQTNGEAGSVVHTSCQSITKTHHTYHHLCSKTGSRTLRQTPLSTAKIHRLTDSSAHLSSQEVHQTLWMTAIPTSRAYVHILVVHITFSKCSQLSQILTKEDTNYYTISP